MTRTTGRCPSGKNRYRDRITALLALANIARRDSPQRLKTERRAYRCPQCNGWHLTSKGARRAPA